MAEDDDEDDSEVCSPWLWLTEWLQLGPCTCPCPGPGPGAILLLPLLLLLLLSGAVGVLGVTARPDMPPIAIIPPLRNRCNACIPPPDEVEADPSPSPPPLPLLLLAPPLLLPVPADVPAGGWGSGGSMVSSDPPA